MKDLHSCFRKCSVPAVMVSRGIGALVYGVFFATISDLMTENRSPKSVLSQDTGALFASK